MTSVIIALPKAEVAQGIRNLLVRSGRYDLFTAA